MRQTSKMDKELKGNLCCHLVLIYEHIHTILYNPYYLSVSGGVNTSVWLMISCFLAGGTGFDPLGDVDGLKQPVDVHR